MFRVGHRSLTGRAARCPAGRPQVDQVVDDEVVDAAAALQGHGVLVALEGQQLPVQRRGQLHPGLVRRGRVTRSWRSPASAAARATFGRCGCEVGGTGQNAHGSSAPTAPRPLSRNGATSFTRRASSACPARSVIRCSSTQLIAMKRLDQVAVVPVRGPLVVLVGQREQDRAVAGGQRGQAAGQHRPVALQVQRLVRPGDGVRVGQRAGLGRPGPGRRSAGGPAPGRRRWPAPGRYRAGSRGAARSRRRRRRRPAGSRRPARRSARRCPAPGPARRPAPCARTRCGNASA